MTWEAEYYHRVRPVVGEALFERRLAVWDLGMGYLAAEALARTGLHDQVWFDGADTTGAFCRSLGMQHAGRSQAAALADHCRGHNHLESGWAFEPHARDLSALARVLDAAPPDLLLARGDGDAAAVARTALERGIPLIMTFVPARGSLSAVQVVWLPGSAAAPEHVIQTCEDLSRVPQLDLDLADNHPVGLEARSQALALCKWILVGEAREDLNRILVEEGRAVIIRGQGDWPWAVRFSSPGPAARPLLDYLSSAPSTYLAPLRLLSRERVLVLGLGTASLFCAEAGLWARQMLFVDCKEVTPVNPVRQIFSTRHVGRHKAEALVEILCRRLEPQAGWERTSRGPITTLQTGSRELSHANLQLSLADSDSPGLFGRLLDDFAPTMAIVGMGRTKNDNFLATAELRRRGIRHVTPSAFPGVSHFKHILTDGGAGPCYDCIQGHLSVDASPAPTLSPEQREMFYGGSQPATLAETYPSAHSLIRLVMDLSFPRGARPPYLLRELAAERPCFVGANRAEQTPGGWMYGVDRPFSMVTFGIDDLASGGTGGQVCSCGRMNAARSP